MDIIINSNDSLRIYNSLRNHTANIKDLDQQERQIVAIALNNIQKDNLGFTSNVNVEGILKKLDSNKFTHLPTSSPQSPPNKKEGESIFSRIEHYIVSFFKGLGNLIGFRIGSQKILEDLSKLQLTTVGLFHTDALKQADERLKKAEDSLNYMYHQKKSQLVELSIYDANLISDFFITHKLAFENQDLSSFKQIFDNYVLELEFRKSRLEQQESFSTIQGAKIILEHAQKVSKELDAIKALMPPSSTQESFSRLVKTFKEHLSKQMGIFNTPSKDAYLHNLELNKQEALNFRNLLFRPKASSSSSV